MIRSSSCISSSSSLEGGLASLAPRRASFHSIDFAKKEDFAIRQDSEYCIGYLRDMYAIFSERVVQPLPENGKQKDFTYRPINYSYFNTKFFLEIEHRRQTSICDGGFGRGIPSQSQACFHRLLFDVVKETICNANTRVGIDFDPENLCDLPGLALDERTRRLPISMGNFMRRIEGAVLKVVSAKVSEQKSVTAEVYFAKSREATQRAKEAIVAQSQQSMEQMVDALCAQEFGKWLAQPDLPKKFYQKLLLIGPEGNEVIFKDLHNLTEYCAQLEGLPIGSEDLFALLVEICTIKTRIVDLIPTLGLDPHTQVVCIRECDDLVENAVKKHRVPQTRSNLQALEVPPSLDSSSIPKSQ